MENKKVTNIEVPASKSILLRALLLSALSDGTIHLSAGELCEDTRALITCLRTLGVSVAEQADGLFVQGCGGNFVRGVELDIKNSAASARFLAAAVAFCGGEAVFHASASMQRRPMSFLRLLEDAGAKVEPLRKDSLFPFRLTSDGIQKTKFTIDTAESTQYASALLMAASALNRPVTVRLNGARTESGYLSMTLALMRAFHIEYSQTGEEITILSRKAPPTEFLVEADLSSACYFCALALLKRTKFLIRRATLNTLQPDLGFLKLLEQRGLIFTETADGLLVDGTLVNSFEGFDEDFSRFSDQALTAAALAPFATTPTRIRNILHTRKQECDRMQAMVENLTALGVRAEIQGADVFIQPTKTNTTNSVVIKTFGDHRVAMAFALINARRPVLIDDPACCKKTFERYFEIFNKLI